MKSKFSFVHLYSELSHPSFPLDFIEFTTFCIERVILSSVSIFYTSFKANSRSDYATISGQIKIVQMNASLSPENGTSSVRHWLQ